MIQKITIGIFTGLLLGIFITSIFVPTETNLLQLILTKITATSILSGVFCGIYAHLSNSKLQIFLISILIGSAIFYIKYLITGHDFDPITMGAFVGAMLGGTFAIINKIMHSIMVYRRLKKLRKKGFYN